MNYKTFDGIVRAIPQLKHLTFNYPKLPTRAHHTNASGNLNEDAFNMAKFAWKKDSKGMKHQKDKYKGNKSSAWALIYAQFSPELKNKLKGMSGYDNVKADNYVVNLLIMVRGYCCQFDTLSNVYMLIVKLLKNLFYFFQKVGQSNFEFHDDFIALVKKLSKSMGEQDCSLTSLI